MDEVKGLWGNKGYTSFGRGAAVRKGRVGSPVPEKQEVILAACLPYLCLDEAIRVTGRGDLTCRDETAAQLWVL